MKYFMLSLVERNRVNRSIREYKGGNKLRYRVLSPKIVLILNKMTRHKICHQYGINEIDLSKSVYEVGKPLKIVYKDGTFFTHEIVENAEDFDEFGLKITTTYKEWFIY